MLGIHTDEDCGRPKLSRRHNRNPFGGRDHMMRCEHVSIVMHNHSATRRFLNRQQRTFIGLPRIKHAQEYDDYSQKDLHGLTGNITLIAPAFCPRTRPSRG